jgi:hypothetical protein
LKTGNTASESIPLRTTSPALISSMPGSSGRALTGFGSRKMRRCGNSPRSSPDSQ